MKKITILILILFNLIVFAQSSTDLDVMEASRLINAENYKGVVRHLQKADQNDYRVQYFLIIAEFKLLQESGTNDFYSVNKIREKSSNYLLNFSLKNSQWSSNINNIREILNEINPAKDPYQFSAFLKIKEKHKDFFNLKYDHAVAKDFIRDLSKMDEEEIEKSLDLIENLLLKIKNYHDQSCELKLMLDKLKVFAKADNASLISQYTSIKKRYPFPYHQEIITKMSNNLSSYKEDSLPTCQ